MNVDLLRSFFLIVEHGSLNRAAERLRVSQSTLTRQMHALEHAVGGRLLERGAAGVALTATGHALADGMRPVLADFDRVIAEVKTLASGKRTTLRVGYLMSAAADYLHPALAQLRRTAPGVKVKLLDLSPGEQIAGLRKGELDVALLGNVGTFLRREFFVRKLASLPIVVALPEQHALAKRATVALAELKSELFIGALEADLPGHNQWIVQLCRRAKFRPRFLGDSDSLTHGLAMVVTEGAVALLPEFVRRATVPGVVFRPLRDARATWELAVAWQRGAVSAPVKAMLAALPAAR